MNNYKLINVMDIEILRSLNQLLKNIILTNDQKEKIFNIICFFYQDPVVEISKLSLNNLIQYCEEEENINNKSFDKLLDDICSITLNEMIMSANMKKSLSHKIAIVFLGNAKSLEISDNEYYG